MCTCFDLRRIKRRGKRSMYIIGFPRGVFVLLLVASGLFIMYMCRGWVTLAWGFLFGGCAHQGDWVGMIPCPLHARVDVYAWHV